MRTAAAASAALLVTGAAACAHAASPAYDANCSVCHQGAGAGAPGQFPRLAGRLSVMAGNPKGRQYLTKVVLNGMSGTIVVDGQPILGVMPSFRTVPDADIAAILNFLAHQGPAAHRVQTFTAEEVEAQRSASLTPQQLNEERKTLVEQKIIP
jgi:mono/diheme cytochrome c family protein